MKEILTEISSDKMALFDRKGKLISAPSTWKYQPPEDIEKIRAAKEIKPFLKGVDSE